MDLTEASRGRQNPGSGKVPVATAVARFCASHGMGTAFVVAGGASMHLMHAFASEVGCSSIAVHHEQAAAMAADGYSRSTRGTGVAIATSGPGATNLLTGIAGCYYDSVPVLFLTGQVSTTRMAGETGVRQLGFQETPIAPMASYVSKSSVQIASPDRIRFELERAAWVMNEGRPGPVLIDIPDDLQRELIDWDALDSFVPPPTRPSGIPVADLNAVEKMLAESLRPVLVAGWGIRLSHAEAAFRRVVDAWGIPVLLTWGGADLLEGGHPLRVGTFGTHGTRYANFAIQNADLVVSVGARLDTKATGSPYLSFARGARKVVVDIDTHELAKFSHLGAPVDLTVRADAAEFLDAVSMLNVGGADRRGWLSTILRWKASFGSLDRDVLHENFVDPSEFMRSLTVSAPTELDLFLDTGCLLPWLLQDLDPRPGHRFFHDFNNTAMGWSLPALVGCLSAKSDRPAACVVGDGSLMMSLHELSTLSKATRAAKVILIDNGGYSMIRQTQDQWLGSNYHGSSPEGGLGFPDYPMLAAAFGFEFMTVRENAEVGGALAALWAAEGDFLLHVVVSPSARVSPQVKFGRPIEDMDPLLPRSVFRQAMLVEPLDASSDS